MYGNNSNIIEDIKWQFRYGGMVKKLIIINVAIYLTVNIFYVIVAFLFQNEALYDTVLQYLMVPASLGNFIYQPWSIFSYMFLHSGFFHILFNMLWLYFFGRILADFIGDKMILPIYVYGGLSGALVYILAYNIFPVYQESLIHSFALGASAGVTAIIVATATLRPNYAMFLIFLGAVRIKWIAAFVVMADFIRIAGTNSGGHLAHLGGAVLGFIFIKQLQSGTDWSLGFNKLLTKIEEAFEPKKEQGPKVVYRSEKVAKEYSTAAPRRAKIVPNVHQSKQGRIDEILDKISASGYDSLTDEEKEFLFKASKDD